MVAHPGAGKGGILILPAGNPMTKVVVGVEASYPSLSEATADMSSLALVLLAVRAFSAGAVGLTGTEAIATGVPAFKPPEARNAATTLAVMSIILGCVGMVVSIVCAIGVPRTWGYLLSWTLKIFGILLGLATPMMYVVGIIFAAIWVSIMVLGKRIDGSPEVW